MSDDFAALLDRVPGWAGRASVIGTLAGGITNRNLLVDVDGDRFVLRLAGKDTELLGIDRSVERLAAQRASSLGIAPAVVAFVEPEQYLVTRFADGDAIPVEEMGQEDVLGHVGPMLRTFHESGDLPGTFNCFRVPEQSARSAAARGVEIPDAFATAMICAREIEAAFSATPEPGVPCHNDLLNANFLRDRSQGAERIWLLDWEYAGMNDRYFDLGNYSVNNELDEAGDAALLLSYFGGISGRRAARLRLMKIMSDLREAMWGVVQQAISNIDFDYAGYAASHFDRLLANASDAGYSSLLDAAASPS